MVREIGMDNDSDINIKEGEVFPNEGAENNKGSGKAVHLMQPIWDEVQRILQRNRLLIQVIDQNKEADEDDGLNRSVTLIRELNSNLIHLVNLYNMLSSSFNRSLVKGSPMVVDGTNEGNKEATTSKVEETYK